MQIYQYDENFIYISEMSIADYQYSDDGAKIEAKIPENCTAIQPIKPDRSGFYKAKFDIEKQTWFESGEPPETQIVKDTVSDSDIVLAEFIIETETRLSALEEKTNA